MARRCGRHDDDPRLQSSLCLLVPSSCGADAEEEEEEAAPWLLLAFEFREDWESIGNFIDWAEEVGMEVCHQELGGYPDDEIYLYTFRWRD
eukprot:s1972_g12.t2